MIGKYYVWDAELLDGWNNEKLADALREPLAELGIDVEINSFIDNYFFYDPDHGHGLMPWELDKIKAEAEYIISRIIQEQRG